METLIEHYGGNPPALRWLLRELVFGRGEYYWSCRTAKSRVICFDDIRDLLARQFNPSELEKQVMYWLALIGNQFHFKNCKQILSQNIAQQITREFDISGWRSLIEEINQLYLTTSRHGYMTERLIEQVCQELPLKKCTIDESCSD